MRVQIFTDGACRGNPGPGGWGGLLRYGQHEKIIKGAELSTTNNKMELKAAIEALKQLKKASHVDLYTDSQYLRLGMSTWIIKWKKNGWKTADKKSVKNADLWQLLDELAAKHHIVWHWVKAHAGHPENELVDTLANQAIDELLQQK